MKTGESTGVTREQGFTISHRPLFSACLVVLILTACAGKPPDGGTRPPFDPTAGSLVEITAGTHHTCVRQKVGRVFCWGRDEFGQIGIGQIVERCPSNNPCASRPKQVTTPDFTLASHVDAGGDNTCAIASQTGHAWCWGQNNEGQTGDGVGGGTKRTPSWVVRGIVFQSISTGNYSACGTSDGLIACWGRVVGQSAPAPTPTYISQFGGPPFYFNTPSVGDGHVCATVAAALGDPVEVRCWGGNSFGESGSNPNIATVTPFGATQLPINSRPSAGNGYTCADTPNGFVQCFGWNGRPMTLGSPTFTGPFTDVPQTVGSNLQLTKVSAAFDHVCALDLTGAAWCWGRGDLGQLGNGVFADSDIPVPVSGGKKFTEIAAGSKHTCAVGDDNHIYCWGDNYDGQLGNPNTAINGSRTATPVQAMDP